MSYVALFLGIAVGAAVIGFVPAYLIARRPIVNPLGSPPCDRCTKDTGKPWLWRQTRTHWLCNGCDAEVTELLFDGLRAVAEQRNALLRLRHELPGNGGACLMTVDLVAFLRARYDEDEQTARDAGGKPWTWEQHYGDMCNDPTCEYGNLATDDTILMTVHAYDIKAPWQGAAHIARHDPARVLADTDAKRELLSHYEAMEAGVLVLTGVDSILSEYRRVILPQLALPYAGHVAYREEWRP